MAGTSSSLRGVLWMGGAVLSFSAMAVAARELLRSMGAFEVVLMRSIVMLALVLALMPGAGVSPRTQRFGKHLARNLVHFVGQCCWVFALGALPLATVFAIEFTMPVWTALLAAAFLGERISPPRMVMLALGLAGVILILRPGASSIHPAAFIMLLGSLAFSAQFIFTKQLTTSEPPLAVIFWMSVIQLPLSLVASLPHWHTPGIPELPWIVAVGTGSFTAHYCINRAMKLADATVVVPIDFIRLPLIAVVGAVFYGEAFDPMVIVGAAIIFAGTYFSLRRETRR